MKKIGSWRGASSVALLVLANACGGDNSELYPSVDEHAAQNSSPVGSTKCSSDSQCAAYQHCLNGATLYCSHGQCYFNGSISGGDIECIKDTDESISSGNQSATCGTVSAPPECDPNDLVCHFERGLESGYNQTRPWLQITADSPNSTVTIHELSGYCIRHDGTVVVNSGTAAGASGITWAAWYDRKGWYNGNEPDVIYNNVFQSGKITYDVPLNPYLLHLGHEGWDITGCREVVVKAVISTTGDAKVEAGLNYNRDGNDFTYESGVSGWKACVNGNVTLTTPRSDSKACVDIVATACVPTVEVCNGKDDDCDGWIDEGSVCTPPPPANGCPATGIRVTPGPELLHPCPNLVVETWDGNGNVLKSAPGQSLTFDGWWYGYAYLEVVCNGNEHNWPPAYTTNQAAGFVQICLNGQDVTSNTLVCPDLHKPKTRPTVPTFKDGLGKCP